MAACNDGMLASVVLWLKFCHDMVYLRTLKVRHLTWLYSNDWRGQRSDCDRISGLAFVRTGIYRRNILQHKPRPFPVQPQILVISNVYNLWRQTYWDVSATLHVMSRQFLHSLQFLHVVTGQVEFGLNQPNTTSRVIALQTGKNTWLFQTKITGNMLNKRTFVNPNSSQTSRMKNELQYE